MKEVEAVILAGGHGSRMGKLGEKTQKCLLPIDGKPVLGHILDTLVEAFGSVNVRIAVAHRTEDIKNFVDCNKPKNVSVVYVPHPPGLGTYYAYSTMRELIRGPFIGVAGDVIALPQAYSNAVELYVKTKPDLTMTFSPKVDEIDTHPVGKINGECVIEYIYPPPPTTNLGTDYLRELSIYASDMTFFQILVNYPPNGKNIEFSFVKAIKNGRQIAGQRYDLKWIHLGYPNDLKKTMENL